MRIRYLWPGIAWTIVILILTGTPGGYIPKVSTLVELFEPDKLVHLFIFGILYILLAFGVEKQPKSGGNVARIRILILLACVLYGGITELLQEYCFTDRTGSWADFIADCAGILFGWYLYTRWFVKPSLPKRLLEKIT